MANGRVDEGECWAPVALMAAQACHKAAVAKDPSMMLHLQAMKALARFGEKSEIGAMRLEVVRVLMACQGCNEHLEGEGEKKECPIVTLAKKVVEDSLPKPVKRGPEDEDGCDAEGR